MFRSLGVQVVTYNNDPSELLRLAEGLSATLSVARRAGVEQIEVYLGDCAAPSTISDVAEAWEAELGSVVDGFSAIDLGANLGSGGGSNALASRHDHEVIWVLNPDTYPSPQCAVELLAALGGDGVAAASDILLASEPTGKLGVVTATALATDWFAVEATAETTFGGGVIASVSSSEIDDDIRCSQAAAGPKAASPGSATATAGDGGGATSEPARTGVREELRPSGAFPGTGLSTAGCDISAAAAGGSWLVLASPSDV